MSVLRQMSQLQYYEVLFPPWMLPIALSRRDAAAGEPLTAMSGQIVAHCRKLASLFVVVDFLTALVGSRTHSLGYVRPRPKPLSRSICRWHVSCVCDVYKLHTRCCVVRP